MTVKEFYEYIKHMDSECEEWDYKLVIALDYPSYGSRVTELVKDIRFGFDWDQGKCFMVTENKLVKSFKDKDSDVVTLEDIELKNLNNEDCN